MEDKNKNEEGQKEIKNEGIQEKQKEEKKKEIKEMSKVEKQKKPQKNENNEKNLTEQKLELLKLFVSDYDSKKNMEN